MACDVLACQRSLPARQSHARTPLGPVVAYRHDSSGDHSRPSTPAGRPVGSARNCLTSRRVAESQMRIVPSAKPAASSLPVGENRTSRAAGGPAERSSDLGPSTSVHRSIRPPPSAMTACGPVRRKVGHRVGGVAVRGIHLLAGRRLPPPDHAVVVHRDEALAIAVGKGAWRPVTGIPLEGGQRRSRRRVPAVDDVLPAREDVPAVGAEGQVVDHLDLPGLVGQRADESPAGDIPQAEVVEIFGGNGDQLAVGRDRRERLLPPAVRVDRGLHRRAEEDRLGRQLAHLPLRAGVADIESAVRRDGDQGRRHEPSALRRDRRPGALGPRPADRSGAWARSSGSGTAIAGALYFATGSPVTASRT